MTFPIAFDSFFEFESRLKNEFMETLFPQFVFQSHTNSSPVIQRLWSKKPQEFVKWCALLRVQDEKWCDRIIDICESVFYFCEEYTIEMILRFYLKIPWELFWMFLCQQKLNQGTNLQFN